MCVHLSACLMAVARVRLRGHVRSFMPSTDAGKHIIPTARVYVYSTRMKAHIQPSCRDQRGRSNKGEEHAIVRACVRACGSTYSEHVSTSEITPTAATQLVSHQLT